MTRIRKMMLDELERRNYSQNYTKTVPTPCPSAPSSLLAGPAMYVLYALGLRIELVLPARVRRRFAGPVRARSRPGLGQLPQGRRTPKKPLAQVPLPITSPALASAPSPTFSEILLSPDAFQRWLAPRACQTAERNHAWRHAKWGFGVEMATRQTGSVKPSRSIHQAVRGGALASASCPRWSDVRRQRVLEGIVAYDHERTSFRVNASTGRSFPIPDLRPGALLRWKTRLRAVCRSQGRRRLIIVLRFRGSGYRLGCLGNSDLRSLGNSSL